MKLKKLLKDLPVKDVKGSKEVEVTGVCANSRLVAPGNLFIAKKGLTTHGAQFIPQVIAAGASAVVTDMYDPSFKEITQIVHEDPGSIEGELASRYHHQPSKELFVIGITGTNGKTSTSYFVKHLLDRPENKCGLIGTIESIIGEQHYPSKHTTPDVCENQKMLREMLLNGCSKAVMEVTSHALEQGRANQIDFQAAIFTNLTQDHLDYHGTMDDYCAAKNRLFRQMEKGTAIINNDDPWKEKIIRGCRVPLLTYGIDTPSDLQASALRISPIGTHFTLSYKERQYSCMVPVLGRFNVYNALAAVGAALCYGMPIEDIVPRLSSLPCVAGRLDVVPNDLGIGIVVDFAHTEDALKNALLTLKELVHGQIICVFGCGGDRDADKRPKMGRTSEEHASFTIITSDNPRSEDPVKICASIAEGIKSKEHYRIIIDRREAIAAAVMMAQPGDMVLIAGKGHERQQISCKQTVPFDDREVAAEICEQLVALS